MSLVVMTTAAVEAVAQSAGAPAPTSQLPPVVVEQPAQQRPTRTVRTRNASAVRSHAASHAVHEGGGAAAAAGGANTARRETAWSHVDGYVATRSGSATKTDTPLIETPASVSVVTLDQIQAQGAQSVA